MVRKYGQLYRETLARLRPTEGELAPQAARELLAMASGKSVAALLAETGEEPERLVLKNAGESLPPQGTVPQLEHALGLDADGVAESVKEVLHEQ